MSLTVLLVPALLLALSLIIWPKAASQKTPALAFVILCALPVVAGVMGVEEHLEHSRETSFCLSCHYMSRYGRSLHVDDSTLLAASHFQGGRIPRDSACYTCHTQYTLFGGIRSKLRGLQHVYMNYLGKVPDKIKLYEPYNNRECLHCHEGTRRYVGAQTHQAEPDRVEKMRTNQLSCVAADCHNAVHAADEVDSMPLWDPYAKAVKP